MAVLRNVIFFLQERPREDDGGPDTTDETPFVPKDDGQWNSLETSDVTERALLNHWIYRWGKYVYIPGQTSQLSRISVFSLNTVCGFTRGIAGQLCLTREGLFY
jgi:hypothetical protein